MKLDDFDAKSSALVIAEAEKLKDNDGYLNIRKLARNVLLAGCDLGIEDSLFMEGLGIVLREGGGYLKKGSFDYAAPDEGMREYNIKNELKFKGARTVGHHQPLPEY